MDNILMYYNITPISLLVLDSKSILFHTAHGMSWAKYNNSMEEMTIVGSQHLPLGAHKHLPLINLLMTHAHLTLVDSFKDPDVSVKLNKHSNL
jgi:hypothetical protein